MRTEAYRLTGFTAVASAVGFLLRWLQDIQILDKETGLAAQGAPISVVMALVIIFMAAALGIIVFRFRRDALPTDPTEALAAESFLHRALNVAPAALIAVAGIVQLIQATGANWAAGQLIFRRILAVLTLAGAYGAFLISTGARRVERKTSLRVGAVLLILFGAIWLIAEYKSAASDPVLWRFAVEILGISAALLAFYHLAGYFFFEPTPRRTIFFCFLGTFLCIMSAVDEHTIGESICYAAVGLQLLAWGYTLTVNRGRGEEEPVQDTGI